MKVHAVFVQYPCRYPGEHAPNMLNAVDEYTHEDNPEPLDKALDQARALASNGDITAWALIDITVDDAAIDAALNPKAEATATIEVTATSRDDA